MDLIRVSREVNSYKNLQPLTPDLKPVFMLNDLLIYQIKTNDTLTSIAEEIGMSSQELLNFHNSNCQKVGLLSFNGLAGIEKIVIPKNYKNEAQIRKEIEQSLPSQNLAPAFFAALYHCKESFLNAGEKTMNLEYEVEVALRENEEESSSDLIASVKCFSFKKDGRTPDDKMSELSISCIDSIKPLLFDVAIGGTIKGIKFFYSLIIDESNISDHPIKSYIDCNQEGYFTVHFIPKSDDLRYFWKANFLENYDFDNIDIEKDSKKIHVVLNNKLNEYNIFAYQIKKNFLSSNGDCTAESAFAKENCVANIYYFNPTNKKWELLKNQKSETLPPYFNSDYFLTNFPQYFTTSTKNTVNNKQSNTSRICSNQSEKWNGVYDLNIDYGKLDDNAEMSINYNLEIKNGTCTFSGLGYKTFFTDVCEIKEENNKLKLKYLKSTDGDGFSDHSNIKILGEITSKNGAYYIKSPIVADLKWNYNKEIKLTKTN